MIERLLKLINKGENETVSDLTPRGVARTVADQRTDFNTTFQHMRQEQLKLYKNEMYQA